LGAIGFGLILVSKLQNWSLDKYVATEVCFDMVQGLTVAILDEIKFGLEGEIPALAKYACIMTSAIDLLVFKGPAIVA
jgi:hypothetical protein